MTAFHPTLTAAVTAEHHARLFRTAADARRAAGHTDTPDSTRHSTPAHRPAWWTRVTGSLTAPRAA